MRFNLDLTEPEYMRFKKRYPVLKDNEGYYFETANPYIDNGFGLRIGLPDELEEYVIYEDSE
jgi:hypothetical protein